MSFRGDEMVKSRDELSDPRTHELIGAAIEVHRELGAGFLENVYHQALTVEFGSRGIPFQPEQRLTILYKGHPLPCNYIADFICFDEIVVELKALPAITGVEQAQTINYLKATKLDIGLIFNFGAKSLQFKRVYRPGQ